MDARSLHMMHRNDVQKFAKWQKKNSYLAQEFFFHVLLNLEYSIYVQKLLLKLQEAR